MSFRDLYRQADRSTGKPLVVAVSAMHSGTAATQGGNRMLRIACYVLWATVVCLMGVGCPSTDSTGARTTLYTTGSDTMIPFAAAWARAYDKAVVEVVGGGSRVGIQGLIRKTVDIANCSRQVTAGEIQLAYEHTGRVPKAHVVGYDAVAIYVARDNPLDEIHVDQLAKIFGKGASLTNWSQLGVTVPGCRKNRIVTVRRTDESGTHDVFRRKILGEGGAYELGGLSAQTSRDLVTLVSHVPCAIGYSSSVFKTAEVKVLKLKVDDAPGLLPAPANVRNGKYPLVRPLYMYTLGTPRGAVKEYLDWVLSESGQEILARLGEVPVSEMAPEGL